MYNNGPNGQMPNQPNPQQFGQPNTLNMSNMPNMANQPPMQPPYPPQYPQQMMAPPVKQPMDPAKKKRIIITISAISGAVLVGIIATIIIVLSLKVDYSSAYRIAKSLKPNIYDIYQNYDCEDVVDYANSEYTSIKTYDGYIDGCKKAYNAETDQLITDLGNTSAVKRNAEIGALFDKFKTNYDALSSGNSENLSAKLALWQAWHNYHVTASDFNFGSTTDAEFTTAANYLINSGNNALKTYGEGILAKWLDIAAAYRTYINTSWNSPDYDENYDNYYNKNNELSDWIAANKPDINDIAPLDLGDTSDMYYAFEDLYDLIAETYAANYNSGSEDCTEFLGEVYCE